MNSNENWEGKVCFGIETLDNYLQLPFTKDDMQTFTIQTLNKLREYYRLEVVVQIKLLGKQSAEGKFRHGGGNLVSVRNIYRARKTMNFMENSNCGKLSVRSVMSPGRQTHIKHLCNLGINLHISHWVCNYWLFAVFLVVNFCEYASVSLRNTIC